jgi:aspartyl-tRNA(Asn)/glutamyl-tRNA(Gln) amidotransferase subunit C
MALTREEVEHIATLGRLGLSDEELEIFGTQLSAILEHFQVLRQLDTEAVQPTTTAVPSENVMRDDVAAPSMLREDVLANAPDAVDDYFRVRAILE